MVKILIILILVTLYINSMHGEPEVSITKSNLKSVHYRGDLIFADEFDNFDLERWRHEITLGGNANWEFQMYTNSRVNSYAQDGILYLKPTRTVDTHGPHSLHTAQLSLHGEMPEDCTNQAFFGCARVGNYPNILNPAMSAKITTMESFYFQYGRVEIRAKLPAGDWMWPQIKLKPRFNSYGSWPASGECELITGRGNRLLFDAFGRNIGTELVITALHFGPNWSHNGFERTLQLNQSPVGEGFDRDFHIYGLEWTDDHITFLMDGVETRIVDIPEGGFWEFGGFDNSSPNPWKYAKNNSRMAPYDEKFYFALNVAVGGTNGHFSDASVNQNGKKPWENDSDRSPLTFWEAVDIWYPTWQGNDGAFQIDYIRVYAI